MEAVFAESIQRPRFLAQLLGLFAGLALLVAAVGTYGVISSLVAERGATVLAVTNVMGSQVTRDAHGVLFTRSGLEVSVAATKTFVAQVAVMYLLALRMAELRGALSPGRIAELVAEIKRIPHCIDEFLSTTTEVIEPIAERHHGADFFLYLGATSASRCASRAP